MATYLSQLMEQTGITLPSNPPWQGGGHVSDIFSEDSGEEAVPSLEEHREVVVPQPFQPAPVMVQPLREETATHQTIPDTPATQPSRVLETVSQVPEVPPVVQSPARGQGSIPTESEANSNPETQLIPELTIIEQVEIPSSTANVSPAVAPQVQKKARSTLEPPTKATQAAVTADNLLEKVETVARETGEMPTPQAYWQVVRDWIAGPPTVIEQVQEIVVEQPTQPSPPFPREEATQPLISQNQPPSPLRLEQISDAQTQQPNLQQDFVLSIGSINLTIAEPPPQKNPPPLVPHQAGPLPTAEPFRLSRHYLRFR